MKIAELKQLLFSLLSRTWFVVSAHAKTTYDPTGEPDTVVGLSGVSAGSLKRGVLMLV